MKNKMEWLLVILAFLNAVYVLIDILYLENYIEMFCNATACAMCLYSYFKISGGQN